MNDNKQKDMLDTYYFSSPAEAVPIITELLVKKNFKILAKYYDLSDSEVKISEMESGDFFIRKVRPKFSHPAGFWRYKHPFAPGFKLNSIEAKSPLNINPELIYTIYTAIKRVDEVLVNVESDLKIATYIKVLKKIIND